MKMSILLTALLFEVFAAQVRCNWHGKLRALFLHILTQAGDSANIMKLLCQNVVEAIPHCL